LAALSAGSRTPAANGPDRRRLRLRIRPVAIAADPLLANVGAAGGAHLADKLIDVEPVKGQAQLAAGDREMSSRSSISLTSNSTFRRIIFMSSRTAPGRSAFISSAATAITTGVSGVRSSWLSTARNLSLAELAASASCLGFAQPLLSLLALADVIKAIDCPGDFSLLVLQRADGHENDNARAVGALDMHFPSCTDGMAPLNTSAIGHWWWGNESAVRPEHLERTAEPLVGIPGRRCPAPQLRGAAVEILNHALKASQE